MWSRRHKAEDCTVKPLQQKNAGQGRVLPTCQICQKRGHIASECWQRTAATLSPGVPTSFTLHYKERPAVQGLPTVQRTHAVSPDSARKATANSNVDCA